MNLSNIDITGIEIIKKEDHVIIRRFNKYFRLGNKEANMVKDILEAKNENYFLETYNLTLQEFHDFLLALQNAGITGEVKKEKKNFLFYKIPLFNPDSLLNKFNKLFLQNKFINSTFLLAATLTIILGFILFFLNFNDITSNFLKGFGFKQYILFYIATIGTVFLHELGHAIVCKHYGGKVNEIGFYLIFFSPALYCDVSGIRAFNKNKHKIATLLAGILVQLIIFAIITILYVNMHIDSNLFSTFICWNLLMIISNIIPVIKLDGYWILSSLVDIPNLYEKSLKLALGKNENVLFDEREVRKANFIKWFGIFNILFVFISIVLGIWGIYYLSITLEGPFKYFALTVEVLIYLLTIIMFGDFIYKIVKAKTQPQKG
ncbi:hypothetical protein [Priestia aryabhattai]|uniref:hypothetical protein n=1 Tax=Priestia aryabhattai TaxID=412384 RepID=UPI003D2AD769